MFQLSVMMTAVALMDRMRLLRSKPSNHNSAGKTFPVWEPVYQCLDRWCVGTSIAYTRQKVPCIHHPHIVIIHPSTGQTEPCTIQKTTQSKGLTHSSLNGPLAKKSSRYTPSSYHDRHGVAGHVQSPVTSSTGHDTILPS